MHKLQMVPVLFMSPNISRWVPPNYNKYFERQKYIKKIHFGSIPKYKSCESNKI